MAVFSSNGSEPLILNPAEDSDPLPLASLFVSNFSSSEVLVTTPNSEDDDDVELVMYGVFTSNGGSLATLEGLVTGTEERVVGQSQPYYSLQNLNMTMDEIRSNPNFSYLDFFNGNDQFQGTGLQDMVAMFGGNDSFTAGNGLDTVFFRGSRAEYNVTQADTTFTVTDTVAGRDGNDTLTEVEILEFQGDNSVIVQMSGTYGSIARIYSAAFGRAPDGEGLRFWIDEYDRGAPIESIANSFLQSQEFQNSYGSLGDLNYVLQLYRNILGREGEADGIDFWYGSLANNASRESVLVGFANSEENIDNVTGDWFF